MGVMGLQHRVWARYQGYYRSFQYVGLATVGVSLARMLIRIPHPDLSGHVCGHYASADYRAFAERMKFKTFLLFGLLWATFVYDAGALGLGKGGWIGALGALDFPAAVHRGAYQLWRLGPRVYCRGQTPWLSDRIYGSA